MACSGNSDCTCGCCEGITVSIPNQIQNRPGLSAIAYRIGKHHDFKSSLLARLSSSDYPELNPFRTRDDDDFTIALLDGWAVVADILTFYQERIANELFLRTSREQLSVNELAKLIGYQPNPGVAASTFIAFTVDDLPGSPTKIPVDERTKIQSTPGPEEEAQTYETVEAIEARLRWNNIQPRLTKPHPISSATTKLIFQGFSINIKPGDGVLYKTDSGPVHFGIISEIEPNQEKNITTVTFQKFTSSPKKNTATLNSFSIHPSLSSPASDYEGSTYLNSEFESEAEIQGFDPEEVYKGLENNPVIKKALIFRTRAAIFGHNAPPWNTLPESLIGQTKEYSVASNGTVSLSSTKNGPFKNDQNKWAERNLDFLEDKPGSWGHLYLDTSYPKIQDESICVIRDGNNWSVFDIKDVVDITKSKFTITAKSTRLTLDSDDNFNLFGIRSTTVFAQSEWMPLAEFPIEDPVTLNSQLELKLDGWVGGLKEGQRVIFSGQEQGGSEDIVSEFVTLEKIEHQLTRSGGTLIRLSSDLEHIFLRNNKFSINANVAEATHGETVQEILGSGDARKEYQAFALKQSPLTYVSAATTSGSASTLEVRVNDILWHETSTLYNKGEEEHIFVTQKDKDGTQWITFGDGKTGSRPPTGQDNIVVKFRKGIGTAGLVNAEQLNILMTRPLGLKEAINPLASSGAADPESLEETQSNAPLTVLTLDRLVSLQDYEDFTRAYAGIDKAFATPFVDDHGKGVFITIAGTDGEEVLAGSTLFIDLLSSLKKFGDPNVRVMVQTYLPAFFNIAGKVKVHPDYLSDLILKEVEIILRNKFSFENRNLTQPVFLSEVIAAMQSVEGVEAIDLDKMYRIATIPLSNALIAEVPTRLFDGSWVSAELLTLDPGPLDYLTEMS